MFYIWCWLVVCGSCLFICMWLLLIISDNCVFVIGVICVVDVFCGGVWVIRYS